MNDELRGLNTEAQVAMDGSQPSVSDAAGYIHIKFQCGPVPEKGVNGTSIENVLELLKIRLEGFQKGPFRCRTNAVAITKIEEAIMWLEERTKQRVEQGVEGTLQAHEEVE